MADKAIDLLKKAGAGEANSAFSDLDFPPHEPHAESSFYEYFILRGLKLDEVKPGLISCSFKVPPRLTDDNGALSAGAIASIVDEIGFAVIHEDGLPMDVSVNMSISCVSAAKANDELEISARLLGRAGGFFATSFLIRNKATGEIVAEGRHSLFRRAASKM